MHTGELIGTMRPRGGIRLDRVLATPSYLTAVVATTVFGGCVCLSLRSLRSRRKGLVWLYDFSPLPWASVQTSFSPQDLLFFPVWASVHVANNGLKLAQKFLYATANLFSSAPRLHCGVSSSKGERELSHIGFFINDQQACGQSAIEAVAMAVKWSISAQIPFITIYDVHGVTPPRNDVSACHSGVANRSLYDSCMGSSFIYDHSSLKPGDMS
eukprot:218617-Rhodomonas_salina.2